MDMRLGNLSIVEIERRSGVEFPHALKDYMKDKKQDVAANVARGRWHCFDIPFVLVCGDMGTATDIYEHLKPLSGEFREPLQIAVNDA